MDVRMPDGTIIKNVPEGTTKAQLQAKLDARNTQAPSYTDQLGRQLGLTLRHGVEGALALPSIAADALGTAMNYIPGVNIPSTSGSISQVLTNMGVPQPETPTERITGAGAQALASAGGMAGAASKLAGPIAGQLAAQPSQQLTGAIGSGLAGQSVAEMGGGPIAQLLASLGGGVLGAARLSTQKPQNFSPVIDEASEQGVKVLTSDVRPPKTFAGRWAQSVGEKIPIAGTGEVRKAQQAQRIGAIRNLLRDYGADDVANVSDDVMKELIKNRSGMVTKYSNMKTDIIDDIGGQVNVKNAIQEIDDQIAKLSGLRTAKVQPAIATLEDFKSSIQGQNLQNIELLRKQLGESFKAEDLVTVKSTTDKAVKAIYKAVVADMGEHIKEFGKRRDFERWSLANARLSRSMKEIEKGALKSVLSRGESTPEVIRQLLFSKKPSEVKLLYKQLSPKGRERAQVAIIQEAYQKALGVEGLSADRFATQVGKLSEQFGVFFQGKDLQRIKGLQRTLDLTRRAQQASLNPPTGVQLAIPAGAAILTDVLGGAGAGIGTAAGVGLLARFYESPGVRNVLMKLPKTKIGSKEEAMLFKRLIAAVQVNENGQ